MKPKLPRVLLWTDKNRLDEFFVEPINRELYDFFLEIRSMSTRIGPMRGTLKMFNEIYYQMTRVEYENKLDVDIDRYVQDIKANMGMLNSDILVIKMIIAFLCLRNNNKDATNNFLKAAMNTHFNLFDEWSKKCLSKNRSYNHKFIVDLTPCPRDIKDLDGELLRWDEITNNFDPSSIKEVLKLWPSKDERIDVLRLIENSYMQARRRLLRFKDEGSYSPLMADYNFFSNLYTDLGEEMGRKWIAREELPHRPTYAELEEENYNMKKKIAHLESDNERLRSEMNPLKMKKNRDRAFTLKMIVDYCKKHLELDKASTIVAMLNKFLRDARDYTQEECELVDSVEIEFMDRKYGDTIMGDKNEFNDNSGLNQIALPPDMSVQEAMKLLQNKCKDNGEER